MFYLKLIDKCIGKNEYEMYQDIPKHSVGYDNDLYKVSYNEYLEKMNYYVQNLTKSFDDKFQCQTNRYIFYVDDTPVGEVGIRLLKNDFYLKGGSQIFYVIRKSYRNKKLGYILIDLIIKECQKLGFTEILANCDTNNIGSNKMLAKHGKIIKTYSRNDGGTSNRYKIIIK